MKGQQQGRPPSTDDTFYTQWGRETLKNNIKLSNDILKQLITLSSALLGVSIIFDDIVKTDWVKILVLLSFFTSLVVAFFGFLPFENKVNLNSPTDIKEHKKKALKCKRWYLWSSAGALTVGFAAIIAEIIIKILK